MKKNSTKKDLSKKIKQYAASTGAFLAVAPMMHAAVVYTDQDPDQVLTTGDNFDLDIDGDGTIDLSFTVFSTTTNIGFPVTIDVVGVLPNGNNELAASTISNQGNMYGAPYAMNDADVIDNGQNWIGTTYDQALGVNIAGAQTIGNWPGESDKYIGVRFFIGAFVHYGWVRLDVNTACDQLVIKDYAYEDQAQTAILAGQGAPVEADAASNLMASDITDFTDGRDLEVAFDAAADESTVGEYRVMVVKSANAATFDLTAAQAVASGNYQMVAKAGTANYSTDMGPSGNDVDGDAIAEGVAYKAFVLATADGTNATIDAISGESNEVTLNFVNALADISDKDGIAVYSFEKQVFVNQLEATSNVEVRIYDMLGQLVHSDAIQDQSTMIDLGQHNSGNYIVAISKDGEWKRKKVNIQ